MDSREAALQRKVEESVNAPEGIFEWFQSGITHMLVNCPVYFSISHYTRSFLYEDKLRLCTLYDEDPLDFTEGGESVSKPLKPSSGDLYRVLCGASEKGRLIYVIFHSSRSYTIAQTRALSNAP